MVNAETYHSRMKEYNERLNASMKKAGKDIHALAKALGISYQAVKKALDGKSKLTAENNSKAADFLGVSSDWLATGKGDDERSSEWPFRKIAYARFMALDADDRAACQHELLSAIEKLEARALDQRKTGS